LERHIVIPLAFEPAMVQLTQFIIYIEYK